MPAPLRSVREQENPVGDRVAYLPEGRPGARDVGRRRDRDEMVFGFTALAIVSGETFPSASGQTS